VTLKTGIIPWLKVWLGPIITVQLSLTVLGVPYKDSTTTVQLRNKNDGRVGGLLLMQDTQLIETLAHFSRERIPERVVHASAAGGTSEGESQKLIVVLTVDIAYGYLEVTNDNSDITSAAFLNGIGKKTDVLLRISTVGPERGAADTVRDPRGWGMKIYTEEGNQDWVFNNTVCISDTRKLQSLAANSSKACLLYPRSDQVSIPQSVTQTKPKDQFSGPQHVLGVSCAFLDANIQLTSDQFPSRQPRRHT
jgi:hypothetical protein